MKKNYFAVFLTIQLLLFSKSILLAQIPTTCFEIQSILVDACGSPEGENEMVRFIIGPNDLNTANLNVTWPNGNYLGICQNAQTATNVATLNSSIQSCGYILEPVAGLLPSGKEILLVTSVNMNPTFNSFAGLADTIYMIFQCTGNTAGHFKNYSAGSGYRTLEMDFGFSCSDTVTYNADSLVDQSGLHFAQDGATVNFTFGGIDTYTNPGCQAPIIPLNVNISSNTDTLCAGDTLQLSAIINGGAYSSFFWLAGNGFYNNPGSLSTGYIPNNNFTGTDLLIFGIVSTCGDTVYDSLGIVISNGTNLLLSTSGSTTFCTGDSVVVTASGGINYLWSTGATTAAIVVYTTGTFTVSAVGVCGLKTDSVITTVTNDSLINFFVSGPVNFCQGDSVALSVANGGLSFLWSNGATTSGIVVMASGTYNVTVTGGCGIVNFSQQVTVTNAPTVNITGNPLLCPGENSLLTASGAITYIWSDGSTNNTISLSNPGTYTVTGSNNCGSQSVSINITLSFINAQFSADTLSGYAPLLVNFTEESSVATNYTWVFGDGGTSNLNNPTYTFNTPGVYQVSLAIEDINGCRDTTFQTIVIYEDSVMLLIPNVFTPNGDASNPYFNVYGKGFHSISGKIYSRWGKEIASWETPGDGWNGKTKNNEDAPEGIYYYILTITFSNGKTENKNGQVLLIR